MQIYVFFTDKSHYLRDMFYNIEQGIWHEGHLHQSKIRIYQKSALLFLTSSLYCQDSEGSLLRIEMKGGQWLDLLNLHAKESDALQRARIGTPVSGDIEQYEDTKVLHREVILYYLSSQGELVRGINRFIGQNQKQNIPGVDNPRVRAWQESPWVNTEREGTPYPDFAIAPKQLTWTTPPIVFRTARDFLNMCWQSKENKARWVFLPQICQTAPKSHFHLHFSCLHSAYETAYIFFFS